MILQQAGRSTPTLLPDGVLGVTNESPWLMAGPKEEKKTKKLCWSAFK
jgi:hypothetical protein